jgi:hypothetical protein
MRMKSSHITPLRATAAARFRAPSDPHIREIDIYILGMHAHLRLANSETRRLQRDAATGSRTSAVEF